MTKKLFSKLTKEDIEGLLNFMEFPFEDIKGFRNTYNSIEFSVVSIWDAGDDNPAITEYDCTLTPTGALCDAFTGIEDDILCERWLLTHVMADADVDAQINEAFPKYELGLSSRELVETLILNGIELVDTKDVSNTSDFVTWSLDTKRRFLQRARSLAGFVQAHIPSV